MGWQKYLQEFDESILKILMSDRTTGRELVFPSDQLEGRSTPFLLKEDVFQADRAGAMPGEAEEQEAFRNWNRELNRLDEVWFERTGVFNTETEDGWQTAAEPVYFEDPFHWKKYINQQIYIPELDWGEALTFTGSRTDISFEKRMGALDRALRLIDENARSEAEWQKRTETALCRILGAGKDPQKLFRARLCALAACREHFENRYSHLPAAKNEKILAGILARNLFQTEDGFNTIPFQEKGETMQLSLFEGGLFQSQDPQLSELVASAAAGSAPLIQMPVRVHRPVSQRPCSLEELRRSMTRKPEKWRILQLPEKEQEAGKKP